MRKHPPDVNVSETCIDANLKMVERRDPDNFPVSRRRNDARGQYPKLPLNTKISHMKTKSIRPFTIRIEDYLVYFSYHNGAST